MLLLRRKDIGADADFSIFIFAAEDSSAADTASVAAHSLLRDLDRKCTALELLKVSRWKSSD